MGFAVTFAAVPLERKDAFLAAAGVSVTDRVDPDGAALISAAEHDDHFLLWWNLRAAPLHSEPDWPVLSQAVPVTVLDVVDTAGAQVLRGFEGGAQVWEVSFQDTNDPILKVEGPVPFDVGPLRESLREDWLADHPEDSEEDDEALVAGYGMEIPARCFETLTGLYYEDGPPEGLFELSADLPQIRLTWSGKPKGTSSPWWKFW